MKDKALAAFMPGRGKNTILRLAANVLGIPLMGEREEDVFEEPQPVQGMGNNRPQPMQPKLQPFTRQSSMPFGNDVPVIQAGYRPQTGGNGMGMERAQRQFTPQMQNNAGFYGRALFGNEAPGVGRNGGYPQMAQRDEIGDLMRALGIGGGAQEQAAPQMQHAPAQNDDMNAQEQNWPTDVPKPHFKPKEKDLYRNNEHSYAIQEKPNMEYWQPLIEKSNEDYNFIPFDMKDEVQNALIIASEKYGIDRRALETMAQIESTGGENMSNGGAYSGLMQLGKEEAKKFNVTDRSDIYQSADGGAQYWLHNAKGLEKNLGRKPDDYEIYLAHQQGLRGATEILTRPDEPMTVIRGDRPYYNNISDDMRKQPVLTGREYAAYIKKKWNNFYYDNPPVLVPIPTSKPIQQ